MSKLADQFISKAGARHIARSSPARSHLALHQIRGVGVEVEVEVERAGRPKLEVRKSHANGARSPSALGPVWRFIATASTSCNVTAGEAIRSFGRRKNSSGAEFGRAPHGRGAASRFPAGVWFGGGAHGRLAGDINGSKDGVHTDPKDIRGSPAVRTKRGGVGAAARPASRVALVPIELQIVARSAGARQLHTLTVAPKDNRW